VKFKITSSWIHKYKTEAGGFTNFQLLILGLREDSQFCSGWIKRLEGKEITEEQKIGFEFGRFVYSYKNPKKFKIKGFSADESKNEKLRALISKLASKYDESFVRLKQMQDQIDEALEIVTKK
jgi:hypothetical protein